MALILGTKAAQHDACFALVKDGNVLGIYEEERFNRVKHGYCSTSLAMEALLNDHKLTVNDIDYVTNYIDPKLFPFSVGDILNHNTITPSSGNQAHQSKYSGMEWYYNAYTGILLAYGFKKSQIKHVRHHLAHLAGVYFPSALNNAAILSSDGFGESESAVMAHGLDNQIRILCNSHFPASLGALYQAFTNFLGWGFGEEGKTMALASYGKPRYLNKFFEDHLRWDENGFVNYQENSLSLLKEFSFDALPLVKQSFGEARSRTEKLTDFHYDLAASIQELTNQNMLQLARNIKALTGAKNLIVTGGVALNSVANGKIMDEGIFEGIYAYPHSNDAGTAVGGALWIENCLPGCKYRSRSVFTGAYLSKAIDKENIESTARFYGLQAEYKSNYHEIAASYIAKGLVIGWIQGKAEIGPRALGNRSILGNPLLPDTKQKINEKVKDREMWRPFAPSVIAEDAHIYFDAEQDLPYMTVVARVKEAWIARLPSVTHIDGTARVQSVKKSVNPKFYELLEQLKQLTGVGMVLNTSYNSGGEPIVNTVEQAIRLFIRSDLDALFIDNMVIVEKESALAVEKFGAIDAVLASVDHSKPLYIAGIIGEDSFEELINALSSRYHKLYTAPELHSNCTQEATEAIERPLDKLLKSENATIAFLGGNHASDWLFNRQLMHKVSMQIGQITDTLDVISIAKDGGVSDLRRLQKFQQIMSSLLPIHD